MDKNIRDYFDKDGNNISNGKKFINANKMTKKEIVFLILSTVNFLFLCPLAIWFIFDLGLNKGLSGINFNDIRFDLLCLYLVLSTYFFIEFLKMGYIKSKFIRVFLTIFLLIAYFVANYITYSIKP